MNINNVSKNKLNNKIRIMKKDTIINTIHPLNILSSKVLYINILIKVIPKILINDLYQKRFICVITYIIFDPWLFISMRILALER